jgi:hypothetical protein
MLIKLANNYILVGRKAFKSYLTSTNLSKIKTSSTRYRQSSIAAIKPLKKINIANSI